jgi:hypothetical protein
VHFNKAFSDLKRPPRISKTEADGFLGANEYALADDRVAIAAARAGDLAGWLHGIRAEHSDYRAAYHSAEAMGAKGCYIP